MPMTEHLLLWIAFPILFLLIRWYFSLRYSNREQFAGIPLALMLILSFGVAYLAVKGINDFTFLFTFIWSILSLWMSIVFYRKLARSASRKTKLSSGRVASIGRHLLPLTCIVLVCLAPIIGYESTTTICIEMNSSLAQPIIYALEDYHDTHSSYPTALEELVPDYLKQIPTPVCQNPLYSFQPNTFRIESCSDSHILYYQVLNMSYAYRYSLEIDRWSRIGVFDGVCTNLPARQSGRDG
jgi:hypothetical protein